MEAVLKHMHICTRALEWQDIFGQLYNSCKAGHMEASTLYIPREFLAAVQHIEQNEEGDPRPHFQLCDVQALNDREVLTQEGDDD